MTIQQVAKQLRLSEQLIRVWIQSGNCPFGYVIRQKDKRNGRNTYFINEAQFCNFIEGKGVNTDGLSNS